jgi:hypothetical protein
VVAKLIPAEAIAVAPAEAVDVSAAAAFNRIARLSMVNLPDHTHSITRHYIRNNLHDAHLETEIIEAKEFYRGAQWPS